MKKAIRLQLYLARCGVCSRRQALEMIKAGQVVLNGRKVLEPSTPVTGQLDCVEVNGKAVHAQDYKYVMLNKPRGITTTKQDRFADKTVMDILPRALRHLHPVGRLDKDTEGLLLLTNDGALTHQMTHPRFEITKTYWVRVKGCLQAESIQKLEKGIIIDTMKTAPAIIKGVVYQQQETQFLLTIHEGRKRQIRKMMHKVGHPVERLKRVAQGPLKLGDLKSGEFRFLNNSEIKKIT